MEKNLSIPDASRADCDARVVFTGHTVVLSAASAGGLRRRTLTG